jgi:hypothetical protein
MFKLRNDNAHRSKNRAHRFARIQKDSRISTYSARIHNKGALEKILEVMHNAYRKDKRHIL